MKKKAGNLNTFGNWVLKKDIFEHYDAICDL